MSIVNNHFCVNCNQSFPSDEELNKHQTIEKIEAKQMIGVSENVSIMFSDVKMIYPALDSNPDTCVILTVPFAGVRTKIIQKGKNEEIKHESDTILVCVTSDKEFFEATQEEFLKRGLFAKVPQPVIEQRWSAESMKQFLFETPASVNPYVLYEKIENRFNHYIDFDGIDGASAFCALYTMGSYFYFLFEYFPYLKAGGEKGSAKSKLGKVFQALAFNANNSGNQSEAAIYRFARETRGTQIIDEGEELNFRNEQRLAYQAVLLNGWERTGSVLRIDTDGGNRPERIPTYSPKIICSIGSLIDTLEDRAFEIILVKTKNRLISSREVHQASKEWIPIRDDLYLCLMQYWREIRGLDASIENKFGLPGRLWNIAKPVILMARFVDKYRSEGKPAIEPQILKFIGSQQKEKETRAESSLTGSLLQALDSILKEEGKLGQEPEDYRWRIAVSKVLDKVRELEGDSPNSVTGKYSVSSKRISGLLKNHHLYKEPKRDQPSGSYSFIVSIQELQDVKERQAVRFTEDTEHTERTEDKNDPPKTEESKTEGDSSQIPAPILSSVSSERSESSVKQGYCAPCDSDYGGFYSEHIKLVHGGKDPN